MVWNWGISFGKRNGENKAKNICPRKGVLGEGDGCIPIEQH